MNTNISNVSPQEVFARQSRDDIVHLVDVRTPPEFEALHADGAQLLPLDRLETVTIDGAGITKPIYLLCNTGNRATQAAEKMIERGYSNVHVVDGGTERWVNDGLPVVRGKASISLERQVQIAIGTLVILKVFLGFTISPVFFALAALIGAGLVFAGLTQSCAMAKLLTHMPWNQRDICQET